MKVLITGGAGFIGSHLAHILAAEAHDLCIIDNLSTGKRENLPLQAHAFHALDIGSKAAREVILQFSPEAIVHCAGQINVRKAYQDPILDAEQNILNTIHLWRSALEVGPQCFIYASTGGAMYGEQAILPIAEKITPQPLSAYGASKYCGEYYCDYFGRLSGIRWLALRYGNVYGPRQNPHGEAGVVAIFLRNILRGDVSMIYGDGQQTRDFVYIDDVIRANMLALQNPRARGIVNIGTGIETSVEMLFKLLCELLGKSTAVQYCPKREGEPQRSVLSTELAEVLLGWRARFDITSGLQQLLRQTALKQAY
jgi:UDP-glucose 4-epimerase